MLFEDNLVNQPVCSGGLGNVFDAIGIKRLLDERMAIPVFSSDEHCQIRFGEDFISHGLAPFECYPHSEGEGQKGGNHEAVRHTFNTGAKRMERAGG